MTPVHLMLSRGGGADAALDIALSKSKFRYFCSWIPQDGVGRMPIALGFNECHRLCGHQGVLECRNKNGTPRLLELGNWSCNRWLSAAAEVY